MKQIYQLQDNIPIFYESKKSRQVLVEFHDGNFLYINGIVDIKVIEGTIDIWGYHMTSNTEKTTIYSSGLYGLIAIQSKNKKKTLVLLEESNLSCDWKAFMKNYIPDFNIFEPTNTRLTPQKSIIDLEVQLNCQFDLSKTPISNHRLVTDEQWEGFGNELMNCSVNQPMKILFAGYQNAGKSTMMCYFINKCLQKWSKVLVLDFDIGKSEFFIPGCISAFIIDSPLLGPNITHLKSPYKSYFFESTNVMTNINMYLEMAKALTNDIKNDQYLEEMPIFINTMGFVKDEGLEILHKLICITSPTDIVQLKLNEYQDLNLHSSIISDSTGATLSYNLWYFTSIVKVKLAKAPYYKSIEKPIKQQLLITSYFSTCLRNTDIYFNDITPYHVNIQNIDVHITEINDLTRDEKLAVINANIVALCISNKSNLCECVGFGFVRNVNMSSGDLYINTPVKLNNLINVNQLRLGKITLPYTFYTKGLPILRYISTKQDNIFNESVTRHYKIMH